MTTTEFDPGLLGEHCWLECANGERVMLPVTRWRDDPDSADELLLAACLGPTLDVGCGPGRLVDALVRRGVIALGVDVSPVAVELTTARGAPALCRNVFDHIPGEGRWRHVLLADGNIGIGGDPVALLRRVRELLRPGGSVLTELDPPGTGLRRQQVRLSSVDGRGGWFDWARVGPDGLDRTAAEAGLDIRWLNERGGRWFAELQRS
ncbi:methyltransferase domain-containing protein [Kutzneria sp. CA-103260]|uniref:methyltransferase domain-containing protein n=1 Tax=Kutzneria sp. CA-103260 TaxID=2802641 RepID=UPI001BF0A30E|nr:class I SAM-dependent methyltransferase [Kutzneria sp. CA-103260]QUQ69329.1 class I SAM-dependent methyltransferase [Kutzneria sp. CA-103260]